MVHLGTHRLIRVGPREQICPFCLASFPGPHHWVGPGNKATFCSHRIYLPTRSDIQSWNSHVNYNG